MDEKNKTTLNIVKSEEKTIFLTVFYHQFLQVTNKVRLISIRVSFFHSSTFTHSSKIYKEDQAKLCMIQPNL